MHVFEDAFMLEVNDPVTLQPRSPGEKGVVFITTLFKHAAPMIRYNMNDVRSRPGRVPLRHRAAAFDQDLRAQRQHGEAPRRQSVSRGGRCSHRRGQPIDGEYVCILEGRVTGREDMTVLVETSG